MSRLLNIYDVVADDLLNASIESLSNEISLLMDVGIGNESFGEKAVDFVKKAIAKLKELFAKIKAKLLAASHRTVDAIDGIRISYKYMDTTGLMLVERGIDEAKRDFEEFRRNMLRTLKEQDPNHTTYNGSLHERYRLRDSICGKMVREFRDKTNSIFNPIKASLGHYKRSGLKGQYELSRNHYVNVTCKKAAAFIDELENDISGIEGAASAYYLISPARDLALYIQSLVNGSCKWLYDPR